MGSVRTLWLIIGNICTWCLRITSDLHREVGVIVEVCGVCVDITALLLAEDAEVVFESEWIHVEIIKRECEDGIEECEGFTFDLEDDGVGQRHDVVACSVWNITPTALVAITVLWIQVL